MADSPINPNNFPNPAGGSSGGGATQAELTNLQRKLSEEAKKMGITLEKSYVDAYKKITPIADRLEEHIRKGLRGRYEEERRDILKNFGQRLAHLKQEGILAKQQAKEKEKVLRELRDSEVKYNEEVERKKQSLGKRVKESLGKEARGLPLVGGMVGAIQEAGPLAGLATVGISAGIGGAIALITKFVDSLLKMNVATTRVNVALLKAGVSEDFYTGKLAGAFSDIPAGLAGPEDFAKWIATLSAAPQALKDVGKDNQGFETFLGHMGQLGITFDESVERTAKAALTWGGTFKDLDKEFLLAKKLTKDTGYGFDTIYDAMQDLNPVMKQLTFSSDEATKASAMFVDSMMKEFKALGMAPEEAKGLTEALGGFVASMSGSKVLGLQALLTGGMPKDVDKFFENLTGKNPTVSMLDIFSKSTEKIIGQMPKGQRTLGVIGMAEQGMLPAMFANPKFAVAMSKLVESGGSDVQARRDLSNAMKKQDQEAADRMKGFEVLANLNGPFANLAQLLTSILDTIAGPLTGGVRSINDVVTHFAAKGLFGHGGYRPPEQLSPITRGGVGTATAQAMINEMNLRKNPRSSRG